jgi:hypothetical protein
MISCQEIESDVIAVKDDNGLTTVYTRDELERLGMSKEVDAILTDCTMLNAAKRDVHGIADGFRLTRGKTVISFNLKTVEWLSRIIEDWKISNDSRFGGKRA